MERNYAIDFIKFFAIVAVVIIHTFPSDHLLGYFIFDNFSRFAVPFFFVASGYLFGLKVRYKPKSMDYFKRYLGKILKIYLCWFLFYFSYDLLRILFEGGNDKQELSKYIEGFSALNILYYGQGTSGYQLWFVISLAWSIAVIYLFFRLKKITSLLILSFCLNIVGLFGQSYSLFYELPVETTRAAMYIGLFYTTLGFWFASPLPNNSFKKWNNNTFLYLFFFFSILQIIEGYWLEKVLHARHGEYFLSTIFLTICLFKFCYNNQQLGIGLFITKIGGNAIGIYAIHVFFIDIVDQLLNAIGLGHVSKHIVWNMMDAFLVFSLSYMTYQSLQFIKVRLLFWK